MSGQHLPGFEVPLHRSLTEPILLAGAPRNIAILNGTIAAALGLGLQMWLAGILVWAIGHSLSVFAARRDPSFAPVLIRHLRQKAWLAC
ncbi:MAG: VirB3 family type IV secretion system protein [Dongiaceae bacterium]